MASKQGILFTGLRYKPLSISGQFMPGCSITFLASRSENLALVYADGALSTPLINPVVAGSDGKFPLIYLDPATIYRAQLFNALGQLQEDDDPISTTIIGAESDAFTPILTGTAGGQTTYLQNVGNYSVINNLLTFSCSISFSSIGTLSGGLSIAGLPSTAVLLPSGQFVGVFSTYVSNLTAGGSVVGLLGSGNNTIGLWHQTTSQGQVQASEFAAGTCTLDISGTYPIF